MGLSIMHFSGCHCCIVPSSRCPCSWPCCCSCCWVSCSLEALLRCGLVTFCDVGPGSAFHLNQKLHLEMPWPTVSSRLLKLPFPLCYEYVPYVTVTVTVTVIVSRVVPARLVLHDIRMWGPTHGTPLIKTCAGHGSLHIRNGKKRTSVLS